MLRLGARRCASTHQEVCRSTELWWGADHRPSATTAGLRAVLGCPVGELSDGLIHTLELVFERADHDRCAPASRGDNAGPSPSKPAVALEKRKMRF